MYEALFLLSTLKTTENYYFQGKVKNPRIKNLNNLHNFIIGLNHTNNLNNMNSDTYRS